MNSISREQYLDLRDKQLLILTDELYKDKQLIELPKVLTYLGITRKAAFADKTFPASKNGGRYYVSKLLLANWLLRVNGA